jgi:hypothetical protein
MNKVLIYVEGQTEETFVRDVLAPHLVGRDVWLIPVLARTKRTSDGRTFKGGIVSYTQVRGDLAKLLGDTSATLVTTMLDYYGLPGDFPGKRSLSERDAYQKVTSLEDAFRRDIDHPRFLPFLTLHEFEALLFAQPEQIVQMFPDAGQVDRLLQEVSGLAPEEIDEGQDTHPAARIGRYLPGYRKRLHGPMIAGRIGLETIRARCIHFRQWMAKLEDLSAA